MRLPCLTRPAQEVTMKQYDVAVIGLGIVGASAVYAAAWAGARVLALDAGVPGGGTSGASFAWLTAVRKEPEPYHRLSAAGMTAHGELSRELGGDAGYHDGVPLEWAEGADEEAAPPRCRSAGAPPNARRNRGATGASVGVDRTTPRDSARASSPRRRGHGDATPGARSVAVAASVCRRGG